MLVVQKHDQKHQAQMHAGPRWLVLGSGLGFSVLITRSTYLDFYTLCRPNHENQQGPNLNPKALTLNACRRRSKLLRTKTSNNNPISSLRKQLKNRMFQLRAAGLQDKASVELSKTIVRSCDSSYYCYNIAEYVKLCCIRLSLTRSQSH